MTTKKIRNSKTTKQSHFTDIFLAVDCAQKFLLDIERDLSKENLFSSMVAGIILPDDPMQSPCSYFSFSGSNAETVDRLLISIRAAPTLESYGNQTLIDLVQMLARKFPPVKRA